MRTREVKAAIARVIKLRQTRRGVVEAVTARLAKLAKESQHRQEVGVWLHPDPARRIEPRLGKGLLLAEACREVLEAHRRKPLLARKWGA